MNKKLYTLYNTLHIALTFAAYKALNHTAKHKFMNDMSLTKPRIMFTLKMVTNKLACNLHRYIPVYQH